MLSPEARAAAYRLVAILLALIDALAASAGGTRRPLLTRLATRILAASLRRLADDLTATAGDAPPETAPACPDPAPDAPTATPRPHPRRPASRRVPAPAHPRTAAARAAAPVAKISLGPSTPTHAQLVPVS